jgi:hypothetical protein
MGRSKLAAPPDYASDEADAKSARATTRRGAGSPDEIFFTDDFSARNFGAGGVFLEASSPLVRRAAAQIPKTMKQHIITKSLLLSAVAALGLATSAFAGGDGDSAASSAAPAPATLGLLGQTYAGVSYSYLHLDASPVNASKYGFEYNQPLNPGFDTVFNYDWSQSGAIAGDRAHEQMVSAALRAFTASQTWGRPYLEAGIGYDWMKFAGTKDHSFVWIAGAGIEFQPTTELSVTPFVRYERANSYADPDLFNYGVKANYWLTRQWALTAEISRNDSQDMAYKFGVNVRF